MPHTDTPERGLFSCPAGYLHRTVGFAGLVGDAPCLFDAETTSLTVRAGLRFVASDPLAEEPVDSLDECPETWGSRIFKVEVWGDLPSPGFLVGDKAVSGPTAQNLCQ